MHLIGFYYKNISRCTVLWISNTKAGSEVIQHMPFYRKTFHGPVLCTLSWAIILYCIPSIRPAVLFTRMLAVIIMW